jgi:hypothetical protein
VESLLVIRETLFVGKIRHFGSNCPMANDEGPMISPAWLFSMADSLGSPAIQ